MSDFTQDEIECLKKMIYKFRQDEILELYNKRRFEEMTFMTTISGGGDCCLAHKRSLLDKVKEFFKKWYSMVR